MFLDDKFIDMLSSNTIRVSFTHRDDTHDFEASPSMLRSYVRMLSRERKRLQVIHIYAIKSVLHLTVVEGSY